MLEWWLVRFANKTGNLTVAEWERLTQAGQRISLNANAESSWAAPHGGVIIVSQGMIRLTINGHHQQHLMRLHPGDMTGTLYPFNATIEALQVAVVHCFSHQEWLATLNQQPTITQKMLNGMASSALDIEQTLSERI